MKITVIMPMYNAEKTVLYSVNSVLNQSWQDVEMLVVDDCSPDNDYQLCLDQYRNDPRVRVIRMEKNGGPAAARNHAIDIAQGDYVTFLDSDDGMLPGALEQLGKAAEKYDADVVHTTGYVIPVVNPSPHDIMSVPEERRLRVISDDQAPKEEYVLSPDTGVRVDGFLHGLYKGCVWGKLFRTSFLRENGIRFALLKMSEDTIFSLECLMKARTYVQIPAWPILYRVTGDSLSRGTRTAKSVENMLRATLGGNVAIQQRLESVPFFREHPEKLREILTHISQLMEDLYIRSAYRIVGRETLEANPGVNAVWDEYCGPNAAFLRKAYYDAHDGYPYIRDFFTEGDFMKNYEESLACQKGRDSSLSPRIPLGAGNQYFLYLGYHDKAAVIEYRFTLDVPVTDANLREAVRRTLRCFPYFRLQPYLNEFGQLVMLENEHDVPVYFIPEDQYLHLGSPETNGYLFCVTAGDHVIRVCASHALGDGRSVFYFAQLLMHEYLTVLGLPSDPAQVPYSEEDPAQGDIMETSFDVCRNMEVHPDGSLYVPGSVFHFPDQCIYSGTQYTRSYCISWAHEELMNAVHSLGTTPVGFMSAVLGDAIYRCYEVQGNDIVGFIPVDMRAMLGSRAQSNFSMNVSIPYTPDDVSLPMADKAGKLRASLKAQATKDNMVSAVQGIIPMYEMMQQIPLNAPEILEMMYQKQAEAEPTRTYLLSNVGAVHLPPDVAKHVERVALRITNLESTPAYVLLSDRDRGMLLANQNFQDAGFLPAVCDILGEYGIHATLTDEGETQCHRVDTTLFERCH